MENYLIILDIETTGFSYKNNEITEIAAIKVNKKNLKIIEEFNTLIDIDGYVPNLITELTGITKNLLNDKGILINKALNLLNIFCNDHPIFAHNSSFDKNFIRHNLIRENIIFYESEWINTIPIFKIKWPHEKNYKLNSLIIKHNLATKEDHRALSDARHTLSLLKMCIL